MAPAFLQGNSQPSTGASAPNPVNCAFISNVTAGNLMVVAISGDDHGQVTGHTSWTITDTLGSTWHLRGTGVVGTGTYYTQLWDAIVPAGGGANTIHWNSTGVAGATFARILVHELSGVDTLDNATTWSAANPESNQAIGAITTAHAVEYVLAWLVHNSGLSSISSPFVLLETSSVEMTAGLVTSSAGAYTPTGNAPGTDYWSVISAGYYSVGGGGGGSVAFTAAAAGAGAAHATVTATGGGGGGGPVPLILTAAGVGQAQAAVTAPVAGSGITTIPIPPSGEPPITTTSRP